MASVWLLWKAVYIGTTLSLIHGESGNHPQVQINTRSSVSPYAELRPVSLVIEKYDHEVAYTLIYAAQQEPEVLWFEEGSIVPSHGYFHSMTGTGLVQIWTNDVRFGFVLLKPPSYKFYIYIETPTLVGEGPVWEYSYQQMDVTIEPGYDIAYAEGISPSITMLNNRDMGDVKVAEFIESFFYDSRDVSVHADPTVLDDETDQGPIERNESTTTDSQQRVRFTINSAFNDTAPEGVSIFKIVPIVEPLDEMVLGYQLVVFVTVHPDALIPGPFPTQAVQLIASCCDTNKTCEAGRPCRLTCLAVGNDIQKVEVFKGDKNSSTQAITPRDTVYFRYTAEASFIVNDVTFGDTYTFKATGRDGSTDSIRVQITVEDEM